MQPWAQACNLTTALRTELEQQTVTFQRFLADTALDTFAPQPFTASATLCLSNSPWYLDYAHLSFWFFYFSTFALVAWLVYMYVVLSRNTETRRILRETRGFSRAQTGDTMTAVLPLTWSVTMLAHAGTHSSNFDENTNATAFSFNVTAYQWGWNYVFPKDIAELLVGAPRLVGRGHTFVPSEVDLYTQLLASARLEYEALLQAAGYHTAQHGRSTPSLPLQTLLPVLSETDAGLPAWANTIPLCRASCPNALSGLMETQDPSFVGNSVRVTATLTLTALKALAQPTRLLPLLFSEGEVLWSSEPSVLCGQLVSTDSELGRFILEECEDLPGSVSSQQTRLLQLPGMLALVGNRLAGLYQHLTTAYTSAGLAPTRGVSGLADFIFSADNSTGFGFEQSLGLALENTNLASSQASEGGLKWPDLGHFLFRAPALLSYLVSQHPLSAASSAALGFMQARGNVLGLVGGALTSPSQSDFWANTGASAFEVSQLAKLVTTHSEGVGSGGKLLSHLTFASLGLNVSSSYSGLSLQAFEALDVGSRSTTNPSCLTGLQHVLDITSLLPSGQRAHSLKSGLNHWLSTTLLSHWGCVCSYPHTLPSTSGFGGFADINAVWTSAGVGFLAIPARLDAGQVGGVSRHLRFMDPTPIFQTLDVLKKTPMGVGFVESSAWLEGLDPVQPSRQSPAVGGDVGQANARPGSVASSHDLTSTSLPQLWSVGWSWYTCVSQLPWERTFRAQFVRRPESGMFLNTVAGLTGAEILSFQRGRFDKNASNLLLADCGYSWAAHLGLPSARSTLDTVRGALLTVYASTLPQPHLDLDPAFIGMAWSAEFSVSRRSDHDAKFSPMWGPLAAAYSQLSASSISDNTWDLDTDPRRLGNQSGRHSFAVFPWTGLIFSTTSASVSATKLGVQPQGLASTAVSLNQLPLANTALSAGTGVCNLGLGALRSTVGKLSFTTPTLPGVELLFLSDSRPLSGWQASVEVWEHRLDPACLGADALGSATPSWQPGFFGGQSVLTSLLGIPATLTCGHGPYAAGRLVQTPSALTPTLPLKDHTLGGYLPLNSEVSTQRRLRVTKGIYLPADVPMHGIFGSKDVIHSWAIPALGVKIDCIPGFSSHRRLLLRWRGLYWGQCMEVCGRYHHWMPILVRVVHKDVFLSWCLAYLRLILSKAEGSGLVVSLATIRELTELCAQLSKPTVVNTL